MVRPKDTEKFTKIAYKIIDFAHDGNELTVYSLSKKLEERPETVRRILDELVRLKVLSKPSLEENLQKGRRRVKLYKLIWDPEKAKEIVQCWKKFHSLRRELNALKHLADSKEQKFEFSELSYKFCPYIVLLGIDLIEGVRGFLGKFDWKTFLDRAIPLYGAVFSLRHDQELRILNEDYVGGEFFVVSGKNSCRFFEEARWVEYVARRKAKMEIENRLLEMFHGENEFQCLSIHYGDGTGALSNYLLGVRYFIEGSRLIVFDFSPNPFLTKTDDENVAKAFKKLIEYLQEKHDKVRFIQVRAISGAMGEFLESLGFEEREKLYLYIKTEKLSSGSRFVVELSRNPPSASEMEWVVRIFEKKVRSGVSP
ncbi:hypothetical protein [Thermococcus thermotolerans]|uniref:hypothetical protein n=1 Tax=Thermococcus thermotolerans TaxID=2969672 RepID=UPI002157AF79|nr:hypothetical protein [Thermococcus thermotolerans]